MTDYLNIISLGSKYMFSYFIIIFLFLTFNLYAIRESILFQLRGAFDNWIT